MTNNGNVFVWGDPYYGGSSVFINPYSNPTIPNPLPIPIDKYRGWIYTGDGTSSNEILSNVVKIYSTADGAFGALTNNGNVFVWGNPYYGGSSVFINSVYRGWIYTGNGKNDNTGNGEKLSNVDKIYSTGYAFAALTKDGNVFVWGAPNYGGSSVYGDSTYRGWIYTGNGTSSNEILSNVVKIYSTGGAFGALTNNGNVFVWGHPEFGGKLQIYNNNNNPSITPITVRRNYKKFIFATSQAYCEMAQYDNNSQIPFHIQTKGDYPKKIKNDVLINAIYENSSIYCNNL